MRSAKKIDLGLIGRKTLFLGLPVLVLAMTASASNVTSSTPPGSTTSGGVAASATFITGNGFINITLNDLEGNPTNVAQLLSGLTFTLSNGATSGTLFSATGTQISVKSGGTFTQAMMPGPTGWGLNNNVSGGVQLSALGFVGSSGLIIGAPGAGGTFSSANSTIAGSSPHSFVLQSITFIVDITGVTSATTVTGATFGFGTTPGQFLVKGCMSTDPSCGLAAPTSVPEPISLLLTGSGLIGLLFLRRRRA